MKRLNVILFSTVIVILTLITANVQEVYAASCTWNGNTDSSWSVATNWSGNTVPGATDTAIFDGTGTKGCNINTNASVCRIRIDAAYGTRAINQKGGYSLTVGSGNYIQAGGIFTGASGAITINGNYTLSGGSFTSTSGTLGIFGVSGVNNTGNFTVSGSAVFTHNNGLVKFEHTPTYDGTSSATIAVNLTASNQLTFYSLCINMLSDGPASSMIYSLSSDTLIVTKTYTQGSTGRYGQLNSGVIIAQDSINVSGNMDDGSDYTLGVGNAFLVAAGSANQYYSSTGGVLPKLVIDKSNTLLSAMGTKTLYVNDFILKNGTFSAPDTLTVRGQSSSNNTGNFTVTGGSFMHNSGIVRFTHSPGYDQAHTATIAINLPSSNKLAFGSLWFLPVENGPGSSQNYTLSSDTLIVTGSYNQGSGGSVYINSGVILAQGNVSFLNGSYGGNVSMAFTGTTAIQTLTYAGTTMLSGAWKVDKTTGSVVLGSNIAFPGTLTITSGTFDQGASFGLTTGGILTIGANGTWANRGTGYISLGGGVVNNGTVIINSNGANCGDAKSILIRSTGTQQAWSGSGNFSITDADIKDQGGTALIAAYNSTNSTGNGANWTINPSCGKTWDGGGTDNNWTTAANWNPEGIPASGETALFDNTSNVKPCVLNASTSIYGFRTTSGYTQTITQSTGAALTIGAGSFRQDGGTFIGSSTATDAININGDFTLSGGSFTSTKGTLYINGITSTNNTGNFTATGGTFTHNSGTVKFNHKPPVWGSQTATIAINFASSNQFTFGSLWFHNNGSDADGNPLWGSEQTYTLSSDTLIVTGAYTQSGNAGTGTESRNLFHHYSHVNSGVIFAKDSVFASAYADGGTANVVVNGGKNQYYKAGGILSDLIVNNPSYSFSAASGTNDLHLRNLTISGGTFSAPSGTLYMDGQWHTDNTGNFTVTGGTFAPNSGTVKFDHNTNYWTTNTATINTDVNPLTFNNLWFCNSWDGEAGTDENQYYALSSDTLVVTGTYTQNGANYDGEAQNVYVNSGVIYAQGNVNFSNAYAYGGSASMVFTGGAASQTLTYAGGAMLSGAWKVDKTSGSVVLGSNITFPGKLRILSGEFSNGASYNLSVGTVVTDSLIIGASGTYTDTGTGDLTLGGPVYNNGVVNINANGTDMGNADDILIRSTVSGTQRNWAGSGSFTIGDADVKDQKSTPPISAISSTNSGNVGANWTFPTDAYPPNNVKNLSVSNITQNSLTLTWTGSDSADAVMTYIVLRRDGIYPTGINDPNAFSKDSVTAGTTSRIISGLPDNSAFNIGLFVRDAAPNWSPATAGSKISATTLDGKPGNPLVFAINNITTTSIQYHINNGNRLPTDVNRTFVWISEFKTDITSKMTNVSDSILTSDLATPRTKSGLTASTKYYIGVIPRDNNGLWSDSVIFDSTSTTITNPLTLALSSDADNVYVKFNNTTSLGNSIDRIYVYYKTAGFITDPYATADTSFTRAQFMALPGNTLTLQSLSKGTWHFSTTLGIGSNRSVITNPKDSITVIFSSPPNPFNLSLYDQVKSDSQVYFIENFFDIDMAVGSDSLIDSACIFKSTDSASLVAEYKTNPSLHIASLFKDIVKIGQPHSATGLSEGTLYFFGITSRNRAGAWARNMAIKRVYTIFKNPCKVEVTETPRKGDSSLVIHITNVAATSALADSIRLFETHGDFVSYQMDPNDNNPIRSYARSALLADTFYDTLRGCVPNTKYFFTVTCGNSTYLSPYPGFAKIDYNINGDTITTGDYKPPVNIFKFRINTPGFDSVGFQLLGNAGATVESVYVFKSLDSAALSTGYKTLTPEIAMTRSAGNGPFTIRPLQEGTIYWLGVAMKNTEKFWSALSDTFFTTAWNPPVCSLTIDSLRTMGNNTATNKIQVYWRSLSATLPSSIKFIYRAYNDVQDTPSVNNQNGFDSVSFAPTENSGMAMISGNVSGLQPQMRYIVSGWEKNSHDVWSLTDSWDTITTNNPDDMIPPDTAVYGPEDLVVSWKALNSKNIQVSWTLSSVTAASALAAENQKLELGYGYNIKGFSEFQKPEFHYTLKNILQADSVVLSNIDPKTIYYFSMSPVDSSNNIAPAFVRSLARCSTLVPGITANQCSVAVTGFNSFKVFWQKATVKSGDSIVFAADTNIKYISLIVTDSGYYTGALPGQDYVSSLGTRFLCHTYPVSECSTEINDLQLNLGTLLVSAYASVGFHAFASDGIPIGTASYTLDKPILTGLSLVQENDSLVKVNFTAIDNTDKKLFISTKLIQFPIPGNRTIMDQFPFPVSASLPGFVSLTADTIKKTDDSWPLKTAYIRLNSDSLGSATRFIGTDNTTLYFKFSLSDMVPNSAIDTSYIDSIVIDRKKPSHAEVTSSFNRSTINWTIEVDDTVKEDLFRVYWGTNAKSIMDSLEFNQAGGPLGLNMSGSDSIFIRLSDRFGNDSDQIIRDFTTEKIKLSEGKALPIDKGNIILQISGSSLKAVVQDRAYLWVGRSRLSTTDSMLTKNSDFSELLPMKYWFTNEIAGVYSGDPNIYNTGILLKYTFDHPANENLRFYRLLYDKNNAACLEYLGGTTGTDSSTGKGYVALNNFNIPVLSDTFIVVIASDNTPPLFDYDASILKFNRFDTTASFVFKVSDNTVNMDSKIRVFTIDSLGIPRTLFDTTTNALHPNSGIATTVICTLTIDSAIKGREKDISERGLFCAMYVSDGTKRFLYSADTLSPDTVSGSLQMVRDSWKIISMPWTIANEMIINPLTNFLGQYDQSRYRLYGAPESGNECVEYDSNNKAFDIRQGKAYLLIVHFSDDVNINYKLAKPMMLPPVKSKGYEITGSGWRFLSIPFSGQVRMESVIRSSLSTHTGGTPDDPANWLGRLWKYKHSSGFERLSSQQEFLPGNNEGFLAYLYENDTLVLPIINDTSFLPKAPVIAAKLNSTCKGDGWRLNVSLSASGRVLDNFSSFGVANSADTFPDFIMPGATCEFGLSDKGALKSVLTHTKSNQGQIFTFLFKPGKEKEKDMEMVFSDIKDIPDKSLVYLDDALQGFAVDLRAKSGRYAFYAGNEPKREFRVVVGDSGFIRAMVKVKPPAQFELAQNNPNPFNPSTLISFNVPEFAPGYVSQTRLVLRIYNLRGQYVTQLVNGPARPGYYRLAWNGMDANGHAMASGIYFYRLSVTDRNGARKYNCTRKMLLAK